jgi:hypothetical protein
MAIHILKKGAKLMNNLSEQAKSDIVTLVTLFDKAEAGTKQFILGYLQCAADHNN